MSDWIQTFSGGKFHPFDPRQDEIKIGDIAHALAMMPRFGGHCRVFYSVAQHSVLVSVNCSPINALWGLLHDACEAYLIDLPRPIKNIPDMASYREAENKVQTAICHRFGLSTTMPNEVQEADERMLATEARDLMAPLTEGWSDMLPTYGESICPISWDHAEEMFMKRFKALWEKHPF